MSASVPLSRQRGAVERSAASLAGGWGHLRPAERERLAEEIKAAAATLAWLERHEARIRDAIGERRDP